METITKELRQKLALQAMTKKQMQLAKDYCLSTSTISGVIHGKIKSVQRPTFASLMKAANGEPVKKSPASKSINSSRSNSVEFTPDELFEKAPRMTTPPKSKNTSETDFGLNNKTFDGLKLKYALEQIKSLKEMLRLNKELTEMLMEKVDMATKFKNQAIQEGLDNFERHNKATHDELKQLRDNFDTLFKRHKYLSDEDQKLKQRIKSLEIKIEPTKFRN